MATTRYYFNRSTTVADTPAFDAGWGVTATALRREMSDVKDGSSIVNHQHGGGTNHAANTAILMRQWCGPPLDLGTEFSTSDTISCVGNCYESNADDNINRQPLCLKVFNGNTLKATLKSFGHYGPNTTEWPATSPNRHVKIWASGVALDANYTTDDPGDYLVLEQGLQISASGGTSVTGTVQNGSAAADDYLLDESDGVLGSDNSWFEFTYTEPAAGGATKTLLLLGVG